MAQTVNGQRVRRNEIALTSVWGMIEDFEQVATEWATDSRGDQLSYMEAWDVTSATIEDLKREFYGGELTSGQERSFFKLLDRLYELHPLFEEMKLHWPDIDELRILRRPGGQRAS